MILKPNNYQVKLTTSFHPRSLLTPGSQAIDEKKKT